MEEVIEIFDSDEESRNLKRRTLTKNRQNNKSDVSRENTVSASESDTSIIRPWGIKASDTDSRENILNRRNKSESPPNLSANKELSLKTKIVRLGGYTNVSKGILTFSKSEGLRINIIDDDNKINIIIGSEDFLYTACIFHSPLFMILVQIGEHTGKLYASSLVPLDSYDKSFILNDVTSRRLVIVVQIDSDKIGYTAHYIDKYFKYNKSIQIHDSSCEFLKLAKSQELVLQIFKDSKKLIPEIENFLNSAAKMSSKTILKFPINEMADAAEVMSSDLACLTDGEFLNDNIIRFYLKYIENEILSPEDKKRTHIFDTFFYHRLTHNTTKQLTKEDSSLKAAERRYLRVKNWTRNIDIFKKDFLIFPINKNAHWYLIIVCYPYMSEPLYDNENESFDLEGNESLSSDDKDKEKEKTASFYGKNSDILTRAKLKASAKELEFTLDDDESADEADGDGSNDSQNLTQTKLKKCSKMPAVLVFDSLSTRNRKRVIATLKEYLFYEYKTKNSGDLKHLETISKMPGIIIKVPQQTNYYDCGIYLLQYVESFFKSPITEFSSTMNKSEWFSVDSIRHKRSKIREIIQRLQIEHSELELNKRNEEKSANANSGVEHDSDTTNRSKKPFLDNNAIEKSTNNFSLNKVSSIPMTNSLKSYLANNNSNSSQNEIDNQQVKNRQHYELSKRPNSPQEIENFDF